MKSKKAKIIWSVVLSVILLICAAVIYYINFNSAGYRMSVRFHGFEQTAHDVWIDKNYTGSKDDALSIIDEARSRVSSYFGSLKSSPVIIITDDSKKISRLGGDHDTMIVMCGSVRCYTSLSSKWLNTDVVAHEMTHAETHTRCDSGKLLTRSQLPIWFDEGLALQNDYREKYDYDSHKKDFPDEMFKAVDFDKLADADNFYALNDKENGDTQRYFNYFISKKEVSQVLGRNSDHNICDLLEKMKNGEKFERVFMIGTD